MKDYGWESWILLTQFCWVTNCGDLSRKEITFGSEFLEYNMGRLGAIGIGFSNCNLWRNKKVGWDRFAWHVTFVIGDCRKTRLWKLTGRPYATRAWFHISRLPIWMSSHFPDFLNSCRLLLAMVFCLLNLIPNINLS